MKQRQILEEMDIEEDDSEENEEQNETGDCSNSRKISDFHPTIRSLGEDLQFERRGAERAEAGWKKSNESKGGLGKSLRQRKKWQDL